jgi:hypothetical protein
VNTLKEMCGFRPVANMLTEPEWYMVKQDLARIVSNLKLVVAFASDCWGFRILSMS